MAFISSLQKLWGPDPTLLISDRVSTGKPQVVVSDKSGIFGVCSCPLLNISFPSSHSEGVTKNEIFEKSAFSAAAVFSAAPDARNNFSSSRIDLLGLAFINDGGKLKF